MDINIGRRPGQVLRGVDRLLAAAADAIPSLPARQRRTSRPMARWLIERGETRVNAAVSALGGFPGSLRSMNRLDDVQLTLTLRYLVVGEGMPHGFAIPMRDVLSASMVRPNRRANDGLVIWYRDGDHTGSFYLAFHGLSRGISGVRRAEGAMQFLIERGVTPVEPEDAWFTPSLFHSWDDARQFAQERIVWCADGLSSVGGWFGATHDASRVWLTETSLLWAGAGQAGVNRIALADIVEARDGAGDRICIGLHDALGHRYDLFFDLSLDHTELERQLNPRVQLMNALASRGVPVATASVPLAPWRAGSVVRPMDRY